MRNKIAKVSLDLPINENFDYLIPQNKSRIQIGERVLVPFRERRLIGYVVGFSNRSRFKKLRPILQIIDNEPLIDKEFLNLAYQLSSYYFCSQGQAIAVMLPSALRGGKKLNNLKTPGEFRQCSGCTQLQKQIKPLLIYDQYNSGRWEIYLAKIKEAVNLNKGVIFLVPEFQNALNAAEYIKDRLDIHPIILSRKQSSKKELEEWLKIKKSEKEIVIGTRSAVFAPVNNLGLIIIDEEQDKSFKQQQNPFYHVREAALMRSKQTAAQLILAAESPSLQSQYLAKKNKFKIINIKNSQKQPLVSIIDMKEQFSIRRKKYPLISLTLETRMQNILSQKGKIILFHNRRGFARTMRCKKCGFKMSCNNCDTDLIYNYEAKILSCPYCNYQQRLVELCPQCKSSYIQFKSPGVERLESELYRLFPYAKIKIFSDNKRADDFDILIATQKILSGPAISKVDLAAVISADVLWNRAQFRAQEEAFSVFLKLRNMAKSNLIVQTFFPEHICLKALKENNPSLFYKQELSERKMLKLAPFNHLINIQLRGVSKIAVENLGQHIADKIKTSDIIDAAQVLYSSASSPEKMRGKFRYEVLLRVKIVNEEFIQRLKSFISKISTHKIIISVDVDPIK